MARRRHSLVLCEFSLSLDIVSLYAYRTFAKKRRTDTRVELYLLPKGRLNESAKATLREWGFGLYRFNKSGAIEEQLVALDQTLDPDLPPLSEFPRRLRSQFGPAYDYFQRAEWVPGFDSACSTFEQLARKYVWDGVDSGRITFVKKSKPPFTLSKTKIDKLTLGQLGEHFDMILSKTAADLEIGAAVKAVNPARREVAHRKGTTKGDDIVRQSVEANMWTIMTAARHFA